MRSIAPHPGPLPRGERGSNRCYSVRTMAWRIGVDVGGTFTDLAVVDDAGGVVRLEKVPTTPADQSIGVAAGLSALVARHDVPAAAVTYLGHGTTVCINAVLERKGARTGLVTTQGMRDLLELRRQIRDDLYDLQADKPAPLVPRDLRREVPERTLASGGLATPLDVDAVRATVGALVAQGVSALAVCFLHSYVNPAHERAVAELVRREFPNLYLSISSDVLPEFREFERLSTTVMNAYVGPVMARYLARFEERVAALGFGARAAHPAVERRRGDRRSGARAAGLHDGLGPDRRRDRRRLPCRARRPSEDHHVRHGRNEHGRVRRRAGDARDGGPEVVSRLPGEGGDGRRGLDRRGRWQPGLDRSGRLPARRPAKRRGRAGPRRVRARRRVAHGDRRQSRTRPPRCRLFSRRRHAPRP